MLGFIKGAIAEFDFNVFGSLKQSLVNLDAMGDLIQDIVSGKITDKELLAIGINEAVGDLHYVIKNWHIVSSKKTYSNATVYNFGKHLAGAYGEMVRAVATVVGAVKSVKALKAKIKAKNKVKVASKTFGNLSNASKYGIDSYSDLSKALKGTGLQAHHIIEKHLADALGISNSNSMLSVAVSKAEHQAFTNAWRKAIPYGTKYGNLSKNEIWGHAQRIYKDYPALLDAAKKTIFE